MFECTVWFKNRVVSLGYFQSLLLGRSEISQRRYERNDRIMQFAIIVQNHSFVIILTRLKLPQCNVYGIQGQITNTIPILQTLTEIRQSITNAKRFSSLNRKDGLKLKMTESILLKSVFWLFSNNTTPILQTLIKFYLIIFISVKLYSQFWTVLPYSLISSIFKLSMINTSVLTI